MQYSTHESAALHVSGEAIYIEDLMNNSECLHGYVCYSSKAHARILNIDFSKALKMKGVSIILKASDISGKNQMGPVVHDEPVLATDTVHFVGQAIALVAAESREIAIAASKEIVVEYEDLQPVTTIDEAKKLSLYLQPPRYMSLGDYELGFQQSTHIISGTQVTGAQEHWYLETQSCLVVPSENDEFKVYSSTQNPTETQIIVCEVLGKQANEVEVEVRRMGGGFGGKETQANHVAAWTALLAEKTRKPVKMKLFRDDDQKITGKRHPYQIEYKVGFDNEGVIQAAEFHINANAGAATDLSMAILERAMMHITNAYFIPNVKITATAWRTNLPSNTAFRGFGAPQAMAAMEQIIDRIAAKLHQEAATIRKKNFFGENDNNITPYRQLIENNRLHVIYEQLTKTSNYWERRKLVDAYNSKNEFFKKGLAITPILFGISFTTSFLNQAGALVNIYTDGSVVVNHGGIEMGQGLHTKIRDIVALELGLDDRFVKVTATNTAKVPNTSPTAASSGADLNGMAVKNATDKLKKRISDSLALYFNETFKDNSSISENMVFQKNIIFDKLNTDRMISFSEAMNLMRMRQISLSATGYYKTPDIHFNKQTGQGKPFFYHATGMAVSEVLVDTLTGRHTIERVDILHDAGESLNPHLDIGQVEGAFVQGVGWCTTEENKWNEKGQLLTHSPDTYKIPTIADIPKIFNVQLLENYPNPNTIRQSKAVGEPPFMLGLSVWLAIKNAVSAANKNCELADFELPATNETIAKLCAKK